LTQSQVDAIVEAYIFELSTSQGFELCMEARPDFEVDYDIEEDNSVRGKIGLRYLLMGKGIKDLLHIYNKAIEAMNSEFKILCYTKVIEYVAQTVIRQEINNAIQGRLASPKALNPDACFVMELESLIEDQRIFKKDRESISLTIEHCCDAIELQKLAPSFMAKLSKLNRTSNINDKKDALSSLATYIVDTRNSIAHAKSNYKPTGNECPDTEMHNFATCLRLVAQQVIRWFGRQHENNRVV